LKKNIGNITFSITFIYALLLTVVSCAPKAKDKVFTNTNVTAYEFQPRNSDTLIASPQANDFQIQSVLGLERAQRSQTAWLDNSVEIFKLAENTILLGDSVSGDDRIQYKTFGHDLLKLFYQTKENATQFNKDQTLFLPAALGFEGNKIKNMLSTMGTAKNIEGIQKVFSTHKIVWPQTQPTLRPAEFIQSIKSYLLETSSLFLENGVSQEFVKSFSSQVDKDYLQALGRGEIKLKNTDQNQSLKESSRLISEVIQTLSFIPEPAIKPLLENLNKAKLYAELIEPRHSSGLPQSERMVKVITGIWLDLTPEQREKYIKPANEMLYSKLSETSEKLLKWFAGRGELALTDIEYYYTLGGAATNEFVSKLNTSCHPDIQTNLASWVLMSDAQKMAYRSKNPTLFNVFSRYTADEVKSEILESYSDGVFHTPFAGGSTIKKFNSDINPICISRIQIILDKSINTYLLSELDNQIRTWGSMIEKVVADKTMQNLNSINTALGSSEEFKAYFTKLASPLISNLIFDEPTIPGIENSKIQLFVDDVNQFRTKRSNWSQFDTGAETLGVSLAAQYRRIIELPELENVAANSKQYYKIIFSQINKMISMIGFRTIDNVLVHSLHKNFRNEESVLGVYKELDVYKYDCSPSKADIQKIKKEKYESALRSGQIPNQDNFVDIREDCSGYENFHDNIFEIPDHLTINGPFEPGSFNEKISTVRSQAEIIRGSALMLKYFNDWQGPNDFDKGLGGEAFGEIHLFPKSAFVNLAVATMTVSIRGFQRENSPLKLFNLAGQEITDWLKNGIPNPDNPVSIEPSKQIIQAAIVDMLPTGPSKIIKLEDMAYFMVSIDEFLKATDGIEQTHASVINPPDKTVKENLEAIIKGRRLLKMMMFGMSNFIVNRMQDPDGGFRAYYSLETNQVIKKDEPRTLEAQLSVIDALLRVYGQWGSQAALMGAVESYYYMNQKIWNPATSFYRMSEDASSVEVKPYIYLKAVMNFKNIAPYLNPNSQAQAQRLFEVYSKEFLRWDQASKPMSTQFH
jgi:hypothetical protein